MWCAGSASSQRAGAAEPVVGGRSRWRSVRQRSAWRPWDFPSCPTWTPRRRCRRRSSSPTRSDVVSSSAWRASAAGTGSTAGSLPVEHALERGRSDSVEGRGGMTSARSDGYARTLCLVVAGVIERPALGRQALAHPLDVLRARQLVGDLSDQDSDVDVVELDRVHQFLGDRPDFVIGQPPRQQREQRHPIGPGHPVGVTRIEPRHDLGEKSVHLPFLLHVDWSGLRRRGRGFVRSYFACLAPRMYRLK